MKGKKKKNSLFRRQLPLQMFVLAGILYLFIFSYIPMFGLIMGFKNYDIVTGVKGIFTSEWVGLKYFKEFVNDFNFWKLIKNTVGISVLKMIFTFPLPIVFAIMLNEMGSYHFKKLVQTCSYLPHFVSWVILANIITNILGANGIFNTVRSAMGATDTVLPMTMPGIFRQLLIGTDVWKEFGYNAVIYLAALTGISPSLYEAAAIDGASRWKRVWHITIPGLVPTIVLLTTLAMGNVLNAGFDQVFNMYNQLVIETGDIIDTYVYRIGITNMQFSLATAAGLFKSVVSFVLVVTSYVCAYKFADYKIF